MNTNTTDPIDAVMNDRTTKAQTGFNAISNAHPGDEMLANALGATTKPLAIFGQGDYCTNENGESVADPLRDFNDRLAIEIGFVRGVKKAFDVAKAGGASASMLADLLILMADKDAPHQAIVAPHRAATQ